MINTKHTIIEIKEFYCKGLSKLKIERFLKKTKKDPRVYSGVFNTPFNDISNKAKDYGFILEEFKHIILRFPQIIGLNPEHVLSKAKRYGFSITKFKSLILKFPQIIALDPEHVLNKAKIYGFTKKEFLNLMLRHPQIIALDPRNILPKAKIYGFDVNKFVILILRNPQIMDLNPEHVLSKASVYGFTKKEFLSLILRHPQITGLDPEHVLKKLRIYGFSDKLIRKIIIKNPPVVDLDHNKILRLNLRLGKLIGLDEQKIKEISFKYYFLNITNPYKKIAVFDVLRNFGFNPNNLDQLIKSKFYLKYNRTISQERLLELKIDSICSWLNTRISIKENNSCITWSELPLKVRNNYKKSFEDIVKKKKYAIHGMRETIAKKRGFVKKSSLTRKLKSAKFKVRLK